MLFCKLCSQARGLALLALVFICSSVSKANNDYDYKQVGWVVVPAQALVQSANCGHVMSAPGGSPTS